MVWPVFPFSTLLWAPAMLWGEQWAWIFPKSRRPCWLIWQKRLDCLRCSNQQGHGPFLLVELLWTKPYGFRIKKQPGCNLWSSVGSLRQPQQLSPTVGMWTIHGCWLVQLLTHSQNLPWRHRLLCDSAQLEVSNCSLMMLPALLGRSHPSVMHNE